MSDTVKTPDITLRLLTRNEHSFQPVWQEVKRGVGKGVMYPALVPTAETWDDYVAFKGLNNIIELVAAKEQQDAQACLSYIVDRADAWVVTYKKDKVKSKDENGNEVETEVEATNDKNEKIVETAKIALGDLQRLMPELLELLEKGSIRGGVTIKSLTEENKLLTAELFDTIKLAKTDPSALLKATEISEKIQRNEEQIRSISEQRKAARNLESED